MQRALATHCRWKHEQVELGSSPEELRDCDDSMTSEQELVTTASSLTRRETLLYSMVASQAAKVTVDNHHIKVTS